MQDEPKVIKKLRPYMTGVLTDKKALKLQSLRFELAREKVNALQLFQEKRRQMLWPKDKDMTELDRKTRLDGDVAVYERNYNFLAQLDEIAKDQIELYRVMSSGLVGGESG